MKKYNNDKIIKGLIYFSFILIFFSCNPSKNNQKNLEKYRQLRVEKLNMSRPLIHNNAALKNSTEDGLMIYEVSNNAINAGKNILKVKIADGQLGKGSMPTLLDAAVFFYRNTDEQNIFEF